MRVNNKLKQKKYIYIYSKYRAPIFDKIFKYVSSNDDNKIINSFGGDIITVKDLKKLWGPHEINDEIINYYIDILHASKKKIGGLKCMVMNSYFFHKLWEQGYDSVKRWTSKKKVLKYGGVK